MSEYPNIKVTKIRNLNRVDISDDDDSDSIEFIPNASKNYSCTNFSEAFGNHRSASISSVTTYNSNYFQ